MWNRRRWKLRRSKSSIKQMLKTRSKSKRQTIGEVKLDTGQASHTQAHVYRYRNRVRIHVDCRLWSQKRCQAPHWTSPKTNLDLYTWHCTELGLGRSSLRSRWPWETNKWLHQLIWRWDNIFLTWGKLLLLVSQNWRNRSRQNIFYFVY